MTRERDAPAAPDEPKHWAESAGPDAGRDRGLASRRLFYRALWLELAENGFKGLTVAAIVRRAGTSRGRFYHLFRDLDDLLVHAHRQHTEETVQSLRRSSATRSAEETICGDIDHVIRSAPDPRLLVAGLELQMLANRNAALRAVVTQDYRRKTAQAEALLRLGIGRGELRRGCDPALRARLIYEVCFGTYLLHFATGGAVDTGSIADEVGRRLRLLFDDIRR